MQPIELTSDKLLLLKLLDKIDERRADYDKALADDEHRKAAEFLKQIKRLVGMVDQLTYGAEGTIVGLDLSANDCRTSAKK